MKNTNKFLLTIVCLFAFLLTMQVKADAQCTAVGTDANGNTVSQVISCEYPVYQKISDDEAVNEEAVALAKEFWIANHPADYAFLLSLTSYQIEITKGELEAMDQGRSGAILASTDEFVIVPNPPPAPKPNDDPVIPSK